ncbi:MAG: hypothetical protein JRN09_00115 [Nitrososphaerota archaeon]|nr:hypothetical protein [Nitrososphaerota archaeon]
MNDDPKSMVVEILRGWLDAYDYAGKRLDVLEGFSREKKLQAVIEALALIAVRKVIADSRVVIRVALGLL